MQSPPLPRYFVLLGPNILLNTMFSHTLSFLSSRSVNDQVSHPYKTTGKITFLYILIFKFLDSNLEDKRFCTKCINNVAFTCRITYGSHKCVCNGTPRSYVMSVQSACCMGLITAVSTARSYGGLHYRCVARRSIWF